MTLYEAMRNSKQSKKDAIYENSKDEPMQSRQDQVSDAANPLAKRSGAGRPATIESPKRSNVYLDESSVKQALLLGKGNVSHGIRIALYRSKQETSSK